MTGIQKKVSLFVILTTFLSLIGCAKVIRIHPSYYATTIPGGKIDKKVAVVIPNDERHKKYTYRAWWAGWNASIEVGEALEEISMKTLSTLYKDIYLMRTKSACEEVDLILTPCVTEYRHDVPTLFPGIIPHTATITIHVKLEDSAGKILIDRDYKGKDSKSGIFDTIFDKMEELAEKVFEQTFEIIANDLRELEK